MQTADDLFQGELDRRGIAYAVTADGFYGLQVEDIDGTPLGMLSTDETPFKASLILSPAFRGLVQPTLGWPVYAVVPCRDFVYVLPAHHRDFLGRLGSIVIREYRNSGHPITKDVLEVSDKGIRAIGTYPDEE